MTNETLDEIVLKFNKLSVQSENVFKANTIVVDYHAVRRVLRTVKVRQVKRRGVKGNKLQRSLKYWYPKHCRKLLPKRMTKQQVLNAGFDLKEDVINV